MDSKLKSALDYLDVASLTREEWVRVGMALKDAGEPVSAWDAWSQQDSRYHRGECEKLWNGFHGSAKPVKSGSIIQLAEEHGWNMGTARGRDLDWNDVIEQDEAFVVKPLPLPKVQKSPAEQMKLFLQTLFASEDWIDIVTDEAFQDEDGKWRPRAGHTVRVGEILRQLDHYKGETAITDTIGDYNRDAGCWVRINPLDNKGHGNANVTAYRYSLVESDTMDMEKQKAILEELQLPIATMVSSGGKSVHALVRIDAKDGTEYRERVNFLYDYLKGKGFVVDEQNKNPARLSRLPGVERGHARQELLAVDVGKATFEAWQKLAEGKEASLPPIVPFGFYVDNPPKLKPELIHGVLRQGHKLMLQGPSKAGKSFALMEMCMALASGQPWLGFECEKTRAIYINMELDADSCGDRFCKIAERMGIDHDTVRNDVFIWNLRGHTLSLDDMMADLIHMMRGIKPGMVVFDPIYKIMTGDENNATDVGHFVGQFDRISTELNTSIAIAHHYTKGAAGMKDTMDRSSGSGVFARDPDAIIDLAPLNMTEEFLRAAGDLNGKRPFRVGTVLREFQSAAPVDVWFDYPVHRVTDECRKLHIVGEQLPFGEYNETKSRNAEIKREDSLWGAYCNADSHSIADMAAYLNKSENAVRMMVRKCAGYSIKNGEISYED